MQAKWAVALAGWALALTIASHAVGGDLQIVTFQEVLNYLKFKVPEARIVRLLQESPAVFVLGDEQLRQLQAAGASPRLIATMQKTGLAGALPSSSIRDFVLILDCSGSMQDYAQDGETKFTTAQREAVSLVRGLPDDRRLALIAHGELLRELRAPDAPGKEEVIRIINALRPSSGPPVAVSLHLAASMLQSSQDLAKVILFTDGIGQNRTK